MKRFIVFLFGLFLSALSYADTCTQSQIDLGNGECIDTKFSVTTSATDSFNFAMSASGTFYIDCDNGGTLTSTADDASNKTVIRNNTDNATYTCTWQSPDIQTIRFAGLATGYSSSNYVSAIQFGTRTPNDSVLQPNLITNINGSLGEIFKSYGGRQDKTKCPHFTELFAGAANLTSLPDNLFSGINFAFFDFAFETSGLTEIPENLFRDLSGQPQNGTFSYTFHNCRNLQSIPENLFKSVQYLSYSLFYGAFANCRSLTSIPSGLFSHIKDSTSATVNSKAFYATFSGCSGLTSLPENLFANITRAEEDLFTNTFKSCSNITGYVPPSMFRGLIENKSGAFASAWTDVFSGTQLDTTCPSGTTEYQTGYEDYWGGKVSCTEDAPHVCSAGEYLPKTYNSCAVCPAGNYCVGGTYSFNETINQGIEPCATGYSSDAGATSCTPNTIFITWDHADSTDITANNAGSVTYGGDIRTPQKAQHINGKIFTGWTFNIPQ